jgi:hypothetical protein
MAKFTFTYVEQPVKVAVDAPICKLPETVDFDHAAVAAGIAALQVVDGCVKVPTCSKAGRGFAVVTADEPFVVETENAHEIAFYTAVANDVNSGDFAEYDCIVAEIDDAAQIESI